MNDSFLLSSIRLRHQFQSLDYLANNQANVSSPGFVARDSGYRQGTFSSWMRERSGPVSTTERPLDVALPAGSYLQVQTPQGVRLTRRGDIRLNDQNQLIVGEGMPVLGESGSPVVVSGSNLSIAADGSVWDAGKAVDKLARVQVATVEGQGSWLQPAAGETLTPDRRDLTVGALESSNVDVVEEQANLVALLRRAQALGQVMQLQDQTMDKAIREIGRGR